MSHNGPMHGRHRLTGAILAAVLMTSVCAGAVNGQRVRDGASRPAASATGTLLVVGDSLTEGANLLGGLGEMLRTRSPWATTVMDHKRGRRVSDAVSVVRSHLSRNRQISAIVVALGTNDMLSHGEASYPATVITALMSVTRGLPVLWVNVTFDGKVRPIQRTRGANFNRTLNSARASWPELRVADWSAAFVPRGASRYIADGIHLTTSGYRSRATWTVSRIIEFATWNSDRTSTTSSSTTSTSTSTTTTVSTSTTSATTTSSTAPAAGTSTTVPGS